MRKKESSISEIKKSRKGKVEINLISGLFKCEHCKRTFCREKTAISHICEGKRRAQQKDEKRVIIGFTVYNRYLTNIIKCQAQSYEKFCKSALYNQFVRFGSYLSNSQILYQEKFIDHLFKNDIEIDKWTTDAIYDKYLIEVLKIEPIDSAVQRSIETMMKWGEEKEASFNHYFKYASENRIINDLRTGQMSCWLLVGSKSGRDFLARCSESSLDVLKPVLDLEYWISKLKSSKNNTNFINEIRKEIELE